MPFWMDLKNLDWLAGDQFNMLTLSIDPEETVLWLPKKRSIFVTLDKEVQVGLLVAQQSVITNIARGYRIPMMSNQQFAHPNL